MYTLCLLTVPCRPYFAVVEADDSGEDEEEELGGLFRVSRAQKSKKVQADALDCSHFTPDASHNWDLEEVQYFLTKAADQAASLLLISEEIKDYK